MAVTRCPDKSWVRVAGPAGASVARGRAVARAVGTRVTETVVVAVMSPVKEMVGDAEITTVAVMVGEMPSSGVSDGREGGVTDGSVGGVIDGLKTDVGGLTDTAVAGMVEVAVGAAGVSVG
jgi:hypothetical protein